MLTRFFQVLFLIIFKSVLADIAYVADSGAPAVFVIDTETQSVVSKVSTGSFPSFIAPIQLVLSQDGNRLYVADQDTSLLYIIDTNEKSSTYNTAIGAASIPTAGGITAIAITPDGSNVYLSSVSMSSVTYCFNTESNAFTEVTGMGAGAVLLSIAIHPSGLYAYATDLVNNGLYAIDTDPQSGAYNTVFSGLPAPLPTSVAFTPNGKLAYLAVNEMGGVVAVIDADPSSMSWNNVIDLVNVDPPFTSLGLILALAISPNTQSAYVVDVDNQLMNTITLATNEVTEQTIISATGMGPDPAIVLLAVTSDSSKVYLTPTAPSIVEVMNATSFLVTNVSNRTSTPFAAPHGVAIKALSSTPIPPSPDTTLYDLNRIRPIYNAEVIEAKKKLRDAGM